MPNWCANIITIMAKDKVLDKIKEQLNTPFELPRHKFVENKIEIETTRFDNPVFAFWNITRPTDNELSQYLKSIEVASNDPYWYSWNVKNWGTKWDVANENDNPWGVNVTYQRQENKMKYEFSTAWTYPAEALIQLSIQHKPATIFLKAYYENDNEFVYAKINKGNFDELFSSPF